MILIEDYIKQLEVEVLALRQQLAAANAREQQYRDWITNNSQHSDSCDVLCLDDDGKHMTCSCGLSEALAQPTDTTALEAMISKAGECMRERCWMTAQPEDSYQDEWFKAKADSCARIRALPGVTIGDLK